jgi:hypothetical protein
MGYGRAKETLLYREIILPSDTSKSSIFSAKRLFLIQMVQFKFKVT